MTELEHHLRQIIEREGPITVARYMEIALGHPTLGYYMRHEPFGRSGDFITAPEISQTFGELIGLWMVVVWQNMGRPEQVHLVELGPGRGTLMADLLRAVHLVPEFLDAVRVCLVETSPRLRDIQRQKLESSGIEICWADSVNDVPDGPVLLVANEFLDALPIHQFVRTEVGWQERAVDIGSEGNLTFELLSVGPLPAAMPPYLAESAFGSVLEHCPAASEIITTIGNRISAQGGAALFIDYGHMVSAAGDTLQAVKNHQYHPPFETPGDADLTAHVDFAALSRAASSTAATVLGPVTQSDFLMRLGIEQRVQQLGAGKSAEKMLELQLGARRLTSVSAMGNLFKVLSLAAPGLSGIEGFRNADLGG